MKEINKYELSQSMNLITSLLLLK